MQTSLKDTRPGADWSGGRISLRARCVRANNASAMTFVGTNTWILSEPNSSDCVVIDPGPEDPQHLDAILAAVREDGLTIKAVLLTHGHLDHSEGAAHLANSVSAPLLARHAGTLDDGVLSVSKDAPVLIVQSIPGHSSDSVAFCFPSDSSIVTGDIVFLQSPTVICWPDGGLAEYLISLNRLKQLIRNEGYTKLLSAHGAPIEDPERVIEQTIAHRYDRLSHIREAIIKSESIDLDIIMENVYTDIDTRLNEAARISVQAQIHYLIEAHDSCIKRAGVYQDS